MAEAHTCAQAFLHVNVPDSQKDVPPTLALHQREQVRERGAMEFGAGALQQVARQRKHGTASTRE